ncbi:cellulose biosynthesis protein BcsR [Providencia burhodogranariea]|uniref:cellulose biosynthesis protein BcsR n=1 Tax=Providencia burhodogranariea TaxID=516074 RepID=UPI0008FAD966
MKNQKIIIKSNELSRYEYTDIENLKYVFSFSELSYQDISENINLKRLASKWPLLLDSSETISRG